MFNWLTAFIDRVRALLGASSPPFVARRPRVLMIVFNPIIEAEGGRRLIQVMNWNDPDRLAADYVADLKKVSYGLLEPVIVERLEVDEWPEKIDGFRYDDSFAQLYRNRGPFHTPDGVNYAALVQQFNLLQRVGGNTLDEVWLFASPYAGFYESTMGGRGAFFCNAPPLADTASCPRRFIVMGFNYERGVGEMLESFGHRCEDMLRRAAPGPFAQFCQYDQNAPGRANCGTVHTAPNGQPTPQDDRDWANRRFVASNCDDWLNYPDFTGATKQVNCEAWGCGDVRQHHVWWLERFPHVAGATGLTANNWWAYVGDPNNVI